MCAQEVRSTAAIGFEPGCVQRFPGCHSNLSSMLAYEEYYNGRCAWAMLVSCLFMCW